MASFLVWLVVFTLGSAPSWGSEPPSSEPSITSTPEWQMLKDSLRGIGLSLEGVGGNLTDVSDYLSSERNALSEDRRLLDVEKQTFEKQRDTLEERGRLYDYLKSENETLRVDLEKAYQKGFLWGGILFVGGIAIGALVGAAL